ncbi:Stk1 family PASTA domain-containing Ser/Thr kinase [Furfurilactobacillus curtus]|uniref:non-specific serine/threonine protein kinase n=1 Tax=Furfurilactobacillus curtus TaxID=1746200 RepID=A0ABQ5JKH9_9LACO
MRANYTLAGRYRIIRPLGEGGMADVYLAHDLILDRDVSVKLLRLDLRDDAGTMRRFQREALAASELVSPHIVSVYDVGEDNGMQYLVMEYVPGTDLKAYIHDHFPIPYAMVINIMEQILDAVAVAHEHGIIHRDLKPQNVLVDAQGNVKISDFGIAVISNQTSMTQTNTVLGSVHYLSPEQARGGMSTKKSDIYSLGIILYEMLTGSVPFEGETAVSVALKHSQSQMPSVRDFDSRIPQALENVVLQATAKRPEDRYASVHDMAVDLQTALAPERRGERHFEPADHGDDGTTKIIPVDQVLAATQATSAAARTTMGKGPSAEPAETTPAKHPRTSRGRKIFLWLLGSFLLLLIIGVLWLWFFPGRVTVPSVSGMTQARATKVLKQNNLATGSIKKQTSETYASGRIIKTNPKIGSQVKRRSRIDLILSAGRPKFVVDDYTGEQFTTAKRQLEKAGLKVKQVKQSSGDIDRGVIIDQDVLPGDAVYKHSTITLTVSSGPKKDKAPEQVKLPDFAGKSQAAIQTWADDHNVNVSFSDEVSSRVDQGSAIRQAPAVGSMLAVGETFTVVISSGPELHSFHVDITIPFSANGQASRDSSSSASTGENDVKIYLADQDKNISDVYQEMQISQDTSVSLPFTLAGGKTGRYIVIRDGKTIMTDNHVTGN